MAVFYGPQNAGPSSLLFEEKTNYAATMTCYAYDDIGKWRSHYPIEIFEDQLAEKILNCRYLAERLEK